MARNRRIFPHFSAHNQAKPNGPARGFTLQRVFSHGIEPAGGFGEQEHPFGLVLAEDAVMDDAGLQKAQAQGVAVLRTALPSFDAGLAVHTALAAEGV